MPWEKENALFIQGLGMNERILVLVTKPFVSDTRETKHLEILSPSPPHP